MDAQFASLLAALGIMAASGVAAWAASGKGRLAAVLGAGGAVIGAVGGLWAAVAILVSGRTESLRLPWAVPYGSFYVELDALSAFFLIPILGLTALAAIYGVGYLRGADPRTAARSWLSFNLLGASMALVIIARNGLLFLVAWEAMTLASFFLVTLEDEKASVRKAGWVYLAATHLGTAFLFLLFLVLGRSAGSLDFDRFAANAASQPLAGWLFVFALIGFGAKAGVAPLHVWLPEAHPAAPSHVSAVMSGVMIKTGIYGMMRMLTLLGPPPAWWGWTLIGAGLLSGVPGVLFALAQHDLKRLLAYHSVENIGIILLGLGLGVMGIHAGLPALAVLGLSGALLHTLNHAIFKGLLFLAAGSVRHGAGTLELDRLGGLAKKMPWTAGAFLVGAAAISGLPPLNGFVSEFLVYLGGLEALMRLPGASAASGAFAVAGLALIGGLAAACFAKAFGIVFSGEPRSKEAETAHECGPAMLWPMAVLALLCPLIGLTAPLALSALKPVLACFGLPQTNGAAASLENAAGLLATIAAVSLLLYALTGGLWLFRKSLLSRRSVGESGTWDCGYARPNARMQYTASSFARPLTAFFGGLLGTRVEFTPPAEHFPSETALHTHTPDVCTERLYGPVFLGIQNLFSFLRRLQGGSVHVYILYIAAALVCLLLWKLT